MESGSRDRLRAWVDVDLDALRRNALRVAEHVAPAGMIPMVKADGYGLGAVAVARALVSLDPYAFGVATVDEGVELRQAGIDHRIVVFSPSPGTDVDGLVEYSLDAAVIGPASLAAFSLADIDLHVELETGMGRAGLDTTRIDTWIRDVQRVAAAGRLASLYTHFHSAASNADATRDQLGRYEATIADLEFMREGRVARLVANSDAIRSHRQYHLDLVRPGLYLYGGGRGRPSSALPDPEAVVSVRARVLEVRDLPSGSTVSYGGTYVTKRDTRLATIAIGYADGLPWASGNSGHVLVGSGHAPIRGRVCMDVTTVDVTDVSRVQSGDVATVVGEGGGSRIELRDLAERSGTIEYEILTGLGGRLPRVHRMSETPSLSDLRG
jgi:alanine racemase